MPTPTPAPVLPSDRVGCVVWWSAATVQVDPRVLRDAMETHCPGHVDLVRKPSAPFPAMRRAMRRRQGAAMGEGWRWEEVDGAGAELVVALAQSHRNVDAREFTATTRLTIAVAFTTGDVTLSRQPEGDEESDAVRALIDRYQIERGFLTHQDVRDVMVKVLLQRSKGQRLKDGGAVYFLPAPHDDVIDALAPVVAHAGVSLVRFPVLSQDGFSVAQLTGSVRAGLDDEIADLRKVVAERLQRVSDGKGARAEAMMAKLIEAEELRAKAKLYAHRLGCEMSESLKAIEDTERLVREAMTVLAGRVA